jgi:hypothetical protein
MSNYTNNETLFLNSNNLIIRKILGQYILYGVLAVGSILNFISIFIFFKIIREERSNQGHMFKYLFMKCVSDFFRVFLFLPSNFMDHGSFFHILFSKVSDYYLVNIFGVGSSFYEIASSLDCLFLVSRKVKWFKKRFIFYLITIFISVFTVFYFLPGYFRFEITKRESDNTYYLKDSPFKQTVFMQYYFLAIYFALRDGLPLTISLVVNSMIIYYLRQRTKMRKILESNKRTILVVNAQVAELKKMKLTIFTSSIVLFRIPAILNFLIFDYKSNIYYDVAMILSHLSFSVSFFGFLLYNNNFRKIFRQSISTLINGLKRLF